MLRFKVKKPSRLTSDELQSWIGLRRTDPNTDSPFFHPEYTRAVGEFRDDVRVGILEQLGVPVGFFPFQGSGARARGVGGRLCEFQGVIAREDLRWCPAELIRGCQLKAWHFDHLVTSHGRFEQHQWTQSDSPYIDLSSGFDTYCAERRQSGSSQIVQVQRKARKIQREIGPLRFEMHTDDTRAFDALLEWKAAQLRKTKRVGLFHFDWIVGLLKRVVATESAGFCGVLSALYAGDRLIAVHLGMRSGPVLHWWFPAFDRSFSRYSPGSILLVELARVAGGAGVSRIDLGRGEERYKRSFMSGAIRLGEGIVHARPGSHALRQKWYLAKQWLRASPGRARLEAPIQLVRRTREYLIIR